jgi:hypothetical protein
MRVFYVTIVTTTLIAAPPAMAQSMNWGDFTPDTTRYLADPAYLPLQGQIYGDLTYNYLTHNNSNQVSKPSGNTWFGHSNTEQNRFLPSFSYGITDDIALSLGWGWGNGLDMVTSHTVLKPAPQLVKNYSLGAEDPTFGATWRAIDQRAAPVNVDVTLAYTPDIFAGRDAGMDNHGNIASGGQAGSFTASVSRETRFFTALAYAGFGYSGRGDVNGLNSSGLNVTHRVGAHPDYTAGLQTEIRPYTWAALNAGVAISFAPQHDVNDFLASAADGGQTNASSHTVSPYIGLVVPLLGQRVVGVLLYEHEFGSGQTITDQNGDIDHAPSGGSDIYSARIKFVLF